MNNEQPFETGPSPPGTGHRVLSCVQAGKWTEERELSVPAERLHCPLPYSPGTFVLQVAGESMAPRFPDGDYIFVDPVVPAENCSLVVVRRTSRDGPCRPDAVVPHHLGAALHTCPPPSQSLVQRSF